MEDHAGPIMKGKRTKRLRPQSPIPFDVAAAASSPTTATSSAELFSGTTEEEEDMANCLILLAQGNEHRKPGKLPVGVEDHNHCRNSNNYDEAAATISPKFTSRRYLETATSTGSRAGYYVYQCKTCNRTFPSFQALGGHRASHKKPKNSTTNHHSNGNFIDPLALPSPSSMEKKQIFSLLPSSSDDEEGHFRKYSSLSLQLGSHNIGSSSFFNQQNGNLKNGNGGSSSKVHECSICGAEFTSGQALGGHMRRHRAAPVAISNPTSAPSPVGAITALSLTPPQTFEGSEEPPPASLSPVHDQAKVNNLSLDLDLNLPASAQDHQVADRQESRGLIRFPSLMEPSPSQQQQQQQQVVEQKNQSANKSSLVFSASPALVDCHY